MIRTPPVLLLALLLAACGEPPPTFGEVHVSATSPLATLSGVTAGQRPAIELSPGCPGYLDPDAPAYLLAVEEEGKVRLTARSSDGPVALVVTDDHEVRCDSDEGTGHEPEVVVEQPGRYRVHVAALREPGALPYQLSVARAGAEAPVEEAVAQEVAVTVTSQPPGATVLDTEGHVLGTTPAMFALPATAAESPPILVLALAEHEAGTVELTRIGEALVGHGVLTRSTPVGIAATANDPQRVWDYHVARQDVNVAESCVIDTAEVDVDIRHTYIGDLRVILESPAGTRLNLHRWAGGSRSNLERTYTMEDRNGVLGRLAGENAQGRWRMSVHDDADEDSGSFRSFTVRFTCRAGSS